MSLRLCLLLFKIVAVFVAVIGLEFQISIMSFATHKKVIEEGDTVVLYLTVNNMHAIDVLPQIKNKKGDMVEYVFQTNFGALKVKNLIGEQYGAKVREQYWGMVL